MIASHTPINPDVQKAMWFEETNPRPTMDAIIRYKMPSSSPYGQPTPEITNLLERKPENRRLWAEFDIASDEWNTLRQMAVSGKTAKEAGLDGIPRQYQTDDPNVTAERNPLTKRIEFTDWNEIKATEAEVQTAIDKKWATWNDIKSMKSIPISAPRDINVNGTLVTATQRRDIKDGRVKVEYRPLGPLDKSKLLPKDSLRDGLFRYPGDINPRASRIKEKDASTLFYYDSLKNIIKASGAKRTQRLEAFQHNLVDNEPDPLKRFIPFFPSRTWPEWWEAALDWVPFVNFESTEKAAGEKEAMKGVGHGIILRQVDREVTFIDANGVEGTVWWSDQSGVGYYADGSVIKESQGKAPGSQLNLVWE